MLWQKHRFFVIFLIINIVAHWKLLLMGSQLAYGDFAPWSETLIQALNKFLYAWEEVGFGSSRQSGNPLGLMWLIFLIIFRSPLISQITYVFLLPTLSYLGFDYLLRKHVGIKNSFSRFLPSLFYTFCPVALGEFVGGSQFSTILVFSLLPLLYANVLSLLKEANTRLIFIQGLFLGVLFSVYIQFVFIFFLSLLAFFFVDMIRTRLRSFVSWLKIALTGLIAILVNPVAFITSTGILINKDIGTETRSFVDSSAQFLMEIKITYEKNPFSAIFRMGSIGAFDYSVEKYWTLPFFIIILFVIFITIYYLYKKRHVHPLILVSLFNFLFITLFIFGTTKEWTFPIFRAIPVLFMFRNPSKLTFLSTFFFSIIFAFSLDKFVEFKLNKLIKIFVLLMFTVIQGVYTWPMFLGDRGLSIQRERYIVTPEYVQAVESVHKLRQDKSKRTAWIPIGHDYTFIKLLWLDQNKLDAQIGIEEFGGSAFENRVLESVYFAFFREDQNALLNALRMSQVDYLVIFKDPYYYHLAALNQEIINNTLEGIPLVSSDDNFDIYQIGTNFPLIFSPQHLYTSNVADSYYSLSKIKTNDTFALLSQSDTQQSGQTPDDYYLFINTSAYSPLISNVVWNETWEWKGSSSIFPKRPEPLTPGNSLYDYIVENLEALPELSSYLISDKVIQEEERTKLLQDYSYILGFFNTFLSNIPEEQLNSDIYSIIRRIFLYIDRSHKELSSKNLLNDSINTQYDEITTNVNKLLKTPCPYDYCYKFGLSQSGEYLINVFDVSKKNENGYILLDDQEIPFKNYLDHNWISAGKHILEAGNHYLGLNLLQEQTKYEFDEEGNTITVFNDEGIKYNFTFLYDFEEDVFLDIYNIPDNSIEITDKYLVWKGTLAAANSDGLCFRKEDGRCYRVFVANLAPNNNYDTVKITFHNDVSSDVNSTNVIKEINVKEQITPIINLGVGQTETQKQLPEITYAKVNPTKYKVHIENISQDFFLVFNQSFNNKWVLQTKDKKIISSNDHYKANYFANSWLIKREDTGIVDNLDLELVFEPQRSLYLSLGVTIITVSICLYFIFRKEPAENK